MARKRNPADAAVEFFQTAELDSARTILAVCKGTIERRAKSEPARAHAAAEGARRPARRSREVGPGEVSTPEGSGAGGPAEGLSTRSGEGS
jgi:hypothetical protein